MNDEIISKSNVGSNIPFADENAINVDGGTSRLVTSWITSKGLTNVEEDTCSRNVQNFTTFRASGLSARRDLPASDGGKMLNHRRELSRQRYAQRQSSASKTDQSDEIETATSRFDNTVTKYQKPKPRPRRQISKERQQQQQQQQQSNYSSSDESVARNKSKSTSSIDTQSVNNILDEYEDLDYRRSSDLSDVGNISVTNFEAIMMNQQKRQQVKSRQIKPVSSAKIQAKSIPMRERIQPVLKVNQQTQVRQRSRDRQKDSNKGHQDTCCASSPATIDAIESGRSKMPEILLRKGEVQKRVDEWLNQAHSQNFSVTREKPLTRSNSSAEQKSQRRYRGQDSKSRSSIDEARDRLNGGTSSSYDDLTRVNRRIERGRPEKVNVGVNTSRGTYKEYLAVKSKQQDYGYNPQLSTTSSRSGDSNPTSRIPQRGLLGSSFKSKRVEADFEEKTASRIANLTKATSESDDRMIVNSNSKMIEVSTGTTMTTTTTMTSSIISYRRPSLKRSGNVNENCAVTAAHLLVKEEMDPSYEPGPSKGSSLPGGSLSVQGEPISPNKDGESRRLAAAASGPTPRPVAADKTVEAACKSTEASTRCAANYPRSSSSRLASTADSDRVIAIELPRRRLQFCSDVRKEPRTIDQSRQEPPIYGLAVSARVRALQGQTESRTPRSRCCQVAGASMEVKRPPVLPRRNLGASPSRDIDSQNEIKMSIGTPSSFKPNNRVYTAISDSQQQPNEQNVARSKITVCENVPPIKIIRYASPDHVEKIYERSLQPQVIHADNLESILRSSLQVSAYSDKIGNSKLDRESTVTKEMLSTLENESYNKIAKSRHEHLETIEEDERKSEGSACKYPEIGLKQCLKVQKSLPNGKSKESPDKKKDNSIYIKWNQQQQVVLNEPAKTFGTFQSASSCQSNIKSSVRSRSPEVKESKCREEIQHDLDESTTISQEPADDYGSTLREDQDHLTIHSRENSNLSTATIPVDELESQRGSRLKAEEDPSRNKFQPGEKLQDRVVEETVKNASERGAVVNEVLVKNLQFEQDLPENPAEQTRPDYVIQQVNFHNILCDDYENEKLKSKKLTKEEMEHRRLIDMLKKGNFEMLKTNSNNQVAIAGQNQVSGASETQGGPNTVLRVIVEHLLYPITLDILYQIFTRFGKVLKIVTFTKNSSFQALIQYADVLSAQTAKFSLDGQNVYNSCCTLRIDYSKMQNLNVKYNNDKSRDYTNPNLPTGDASLDAASLALSGELLLMGPGSQPRARIPVESIAGAPGVLPTPFAMHGLASPLAGPYNGVPPAGGLAGLGGFPLGAAGLGVRVQGNAQASAVLLVSNLNEEMVTPDALFTLFGVYGDVQRVKILYNKKDSALIQMAEPHQALLALTHMDKLRVFGKQIKVMLSKHQTVQLPKEGQPDAGLTKDYTNSTLHRFKKPGSKNYQNIYPPSATLHLSNIPGTVAEEEIKDAFTKNGFTVKAFKFFPKDRKMALIQMPNMDDAVAALIKMHNYQLSESNHLRVSFSKSNI